MTEQSPPTQLSPESAAVFLDRADRLFDEMIGQQHRKVLRLAREVLPHLSEEDLRNPYDFAELKEHPTFEYEDGMLNGLIAAQIAVRAEIRQLILPPEPVR